MNIYKYSILIFNLTILTFSYLARTSLLNHDSLIKEYSLKLLPQGWAEFTLSSNTPTFSISKFEDGNWFPKTISNSEYKNSFGLSRSARRIHLESIVVLNESLKLNWGSNQNLEDLQSETCFNQMEMKPILKKVKPGLYRITKENINPNFYFNDIKLKEHFYIELTTHDLL